MRLSGRIMSRMLLPRMDSVSIATGLRPRTVILTCFKCMFMLTSQPARRAQGDSEMKGKQGRDTADYPATRCPRSNFDQPRIVPCTAVPFFSSTVTVSFDSFIKNLRGASRWRLESGT